MTRGGDSTRVRGGRVRGPFRVRLERITVEDVLLGREKDHDRIV
jgi:hypothetical protein